MHIVGFCSRLSSSKGHTSRGAHQAQTSSRRTSSPEAPQVIQLQINHTTEALYLSSTTQHVTNVHTLDYIAGQRPMQVNAGRQQLCLKDLNLF